MLVSRVLVGAVGDPGGLLQCGLLNAISSLIQKAGGLCSALLMCRQASLQLLALGHILRTARLVGEGQLSHLSLWLRGTECRSLSEKGCDDHVIHFCENQQETRVQRF